MGMKTAAFSLTALLAASAHAQPPAYFAAPDFPLTVRAEPGGAAIGELPAGARPLEATGYDGGRSWVRIYFGESDGWVARDALTPIEPKMLETAPLPDGLLCQGAEPFWSLRFTGAQANFAAPDADPVAFEISRVAIAAGRKTFPVAMTLIGGEASGVALLHDAACGDGATDATFPWTVDFVTQREGAPVLMTGCCRMTIEE